ncbi:MAG: hypothetical protein V1835_00985 [Candidatus Micrarchaeota archaeon]
MSQEGNRLEEKGRLEPQSGSRLGRKAKISLGIAGAGALLMLAFGANKYLDGRPAFSNAELKKIAEVAKTPEFQKATNFRLPPDSSKVLIPDLNDRHNVVLEWAYWDKPDAYQQPNDTISDSAANLVAAYIGKRTGISIDKLRKSFLTVKISGEGNAVAKRGLILSKPTPKELMRKFVERRYGKRR